MGWFPQEKLPDTKDFRCGFPYWKASEYMEGEFTLIFSIGLVKPFLRLIRGERPTSLPRKPWRSPSLPSSPTKRNRQQKEACCAAVSSENPDGASEERKNCSLHFSSLQFLHPMEQVAVRKREG